MFVGIICACTPSAARSSNHHLQQFDSIKSYISSHLGLSSFKQSKESTSSGPTESQKKRKGKYHSKQYSTIDDVYQGLGQVDGKSIRTYIQSGKQHGVENNGIHLTYEMQNHISQAHR